MNVCATHMAFVSPTAWAALATFKSLDKERAYIHLQQFVQTHR
jgi:hypothetical protein